MSLISSRTAWPRSASHTRGLAHGSRGNLGCAIEHCPDWSMADLVWHLASVHWFWNEVATRLRRARPMTWSTGAPADDELIATTARRRSSAPRGHAALSRPAGPLLDVGAGGERLVHHPAPGAGGRVHHWDAVNAVQASAGRWTSVVAADAIDEFLTHLASRTRAGRCPTPRRSAARFGSAPAATSESDLARD